MPKKKEVEPKNIFTMEYNEKNICISYNILKLNMYPPS